MPIEFLCAWLLVCYQYSLFVVCFALLHTQGIQPVLYAREGDADPLEACAQGSATCAVACSAHLVY